MRAELSDRITERQNLRSAARTALIVAAVCFAMPFFNVAVGEVKATFSLWQCATTAFRYSDIGYLFPESAASMFIVCRVIAWLTMISVTLALILTFNNNRANAGTDNSRVVLVFAALGFGGGLGLYLYTRYFCGRFLTDAAVLGVDVGGMAFLAALLVAVLSLIVKMVKNRTVLAALLILIAVPLTIIFGTMLLGDRKYLFISVLVVFETMLPFFLIYENRKPEARELVLIAVIAAIAVVGRAAFFMLPAFKPVIAIVIIASCCLGPEAGFLTGAMTAFVSNFFFGQGPWTPWQMFSYGIIGFLSGLLFSRGLLSRKRLPLCIYGAVVTIAVFGFLMDIYTIVSLGYKEWSQMFLTFASGLAYNSIHATATFVFLFIFSKPMIAKIDRVRIKYGMLDPYKGRPPKKAKTAVKEE